MKNFGTDYTVGCHPNILKRLFETNLQEEDGYGLDRYSVEARDIIKEKLKNQKAEVFFLSGGTQTNLIGISAMLKMYEAVISANTGHIFVNETGSIEATGHKVISVDTKNGKLIGNDVENVLKAHTLYPHVLKPKLVYISNTTEIGTVYTKAELQDLYNACKKNNLILFMDGARLGSALMSKSTDLEFSDLSTLTDIFYIGGTKNGALLGEALVFNDPILAKDFAFVVKQKGGLLAKGRVLAIQFLELFKDDLFFEIAEHANNMALKLSNGIKSLGYEFFQEPVSNLIFPILPNELLEKLKKNYSFSFIGKYDETHSIIRLVTSWATDEESIEKLINEIKEL